MNNIIFHLPYLLNDKRVSASQLRPLKMLNAFQSIGYNVDVVMGNGKQRKKQINYIKNRIKNGVKYDFLYSESSTMPTLLTEQHHFPAFPFLDFSFFSFCKKHNIPIGLFYRDIYWRFKEYKDSLSFFKYHYAKLFYKYDLVKYNILLDKVYLPSVKMAEYIPYINESKFDCLPPGHDNIEVKNTLVNTSDKNIKLLYVGGVSVNYQLHLLLEVVSEQKGFELIICTRKEDWTKMKTEYKPFLADNIKVVHLRGEELVNLYNDIDIATLFVKPSVYRDFAFPVKLIEYIGNNKPIIASSDTLAGVFVKENDIGWTIKYSKQDLEELLLRISKDLKVIDGKINNVRKIKDNHSWYSRAKKVEADLL